MVEVSAADRREGAAGPDLPPLAELPGLLARSSNGLEFIYQALEVVATRFQLLDAVVVIESRTAGRQLFRLGRRAIRAGIGSREWAWLREISSAPPGLYTDPPVVDRATATFVTNLVDVALRLDILDHNASHDPLTGLLNRRSYERDLGMAVARHERYGWPFALLLLDLDKFKTVNDVHGHAAGDEALRSVGREIRACLRSGDVAARIGGDEFALILLNAETPGVVVPLAERLAVALEGVLPRTGIRFSFGVAYLPKDAVDAAALTQVAERRLDQNKVSLG